MRVIDVRCLIAVLLTVVACGGGASGGGGPYTPPATTASEDGWETYVNAPTVDRGAARGLDPDASQSPEAAVVKFLASRLRGDRAWRDSMAVEQSDRARRSLEEWDEWTLEGFQLRGRKPHGDGSRAWIRVHFVISIGDDRDEGEDEFEVTNLPTLGWRISDLPS